MADAATGTKGREALVKKFAKSERPARPEDATGPLLFFVRPAIAAPQLHRS